MSTPKCNVIILITSSFFHILQDLAPILINACLYLNLQLEWADLCEISCHMLNWEVKMCSHLGLTEVDIHDISKGINDLELTSEVYSRLNFLSSCYSSLGERL